jgi:hypothetical protein
LNDTRPGAIGSLGPAVVPFVLAGVTLGGGGWLAVCALCDSAAVEPAGAFEVTVVDAGDFATTLGSVEGAIRLTSGCTDVVWAFSAGVPAAGPAADMDVAAETPVLPGERLLFAGFAL